MTASPHSSTAQPSQKKAARLLSALLAASALTSAGQAAAQVTAASGGPQVNSNLGVPIVNIVAPDASGLSHNRYTDFSVTSKGVVLNNQAGTSGVQTQLADLIGANPNLSGGAASKILNEVTSTNRSVINGFIEVAGSKAEVFVANPNGITCGGCGFINTSGGTLTTGVPAFANGVFQGFTVNGGDILITGSGVNATAADYLALVARSIKVDGQINAKTLDLVSGRTSWNALTRTATGLTSDGSTGPVYGIDSTALGGMYAGRIRLIATEAGVGVRALGDVAATGADFSIDAAGKVLLANRISAVNVTVASRATGGDAVTATGAQLTASQDLTLAGGSTGGVTLDGGVLSAAGQLTLSGTSLVDAATTNTALTDNNKRAGAASTTLSFTGAGQIGAVSYGSGAALTAAFGSLAALPTGAVFGAQTGLTLSSTAGDLALGAGQVRGATVTLTASGELSTLAAAQIQATTGALTLKGATITNAGVASSDAGALNVLAASAVTNSGTLHAGGTLTVADTANAGGEAFTNTGTVIGDGKGVFKAAAFTNSGGLQTHDEATVTAASLTNSGKLLIGTVNGAVASIDANNLSNQSTGLIQAAGPLTLYFSNLNGQTAGLDNAGQVIGGDAVTLKTADGASSFGVTNRATGVIQAARALSFGGHGAFVSQSGTVLGATITGQLDTLANSGQFQSTDAMNLTVAGALTNSGSLIVSAASGGVANLTAGSIANSSGGQIQAAGGLKLNAKSTLDNAGKITAADDLTLREADGGGASTLAITNAAGAYLQAGGALDIQSLTLAPLTFATNSGTLLGSTLAITLPTLTNAGVIQGDSGLLSVTGAFSNAAGSTLTLSTSSAGGATLAADSIGNAGTIQAVNDATLRIGGSLTNAATGLMNIAGALAMADQGAGSNHTFANSGKVVVGGALTVGSFSAPSSWTLQESAGSVSAGNADIYGSIVLNNTSTLSTASALNIVGPALTIDNGSKLVGGAGLSVDSGNGYQGAAGRAAINGLVYSPTQVSLTGFDVTVGATGGLLSNGGMTLGILGAADSSVTNAGQIYAAGDIGSLGRSFSNSGSIDIGGSGNFVVDAGGAFTNTNHVAAGADLRINAATILNTTTATVVYSNAPPGFIPATLNKLDTDQGRDGGDHDDTEDRTTQAYQEINGILIKLGCTTTGQYDCHNSDAYTSTDRTPHGDTYNHEYVYDPIIASYSVPYVRASISAGSNLELSGFSSAINNASSLTASNIGIFGANNNATFTNSSLQTGTLHVTATWNDYKNPSTLYVNFQKIVTQVDNEDDQGGQIHAGTLTAANFNLVNNGPTNVPAPNKTATPSTNTSLPAGVQAAMAASQQQAAQTAAAAGALTFGGLSISLPSSPNGLYVVSQDPSSKYLVVTNPILTTPTTPVTTPVVIITPPITTTTPTTPTTPPTPTPTPVPTPATTPAVDSDYLAAELGLDADRLQQRLGDAAYENYLIQQQLLVQAGTSQLYVSDTYAQQTRALYDQAAAQASSLKLAWGAPLSSAQQAGLKSDIVWMVSTVVQGHTVLAPVVYLASATKSAFDTGATTIAANDANLQLASLTNTGGVISGAKTLAIVSTGDITNTSGVIRGGDVSVTSTNGNIVNQTATRTVDDGTDTHTIIDKTASIQADTLSLDAKNDIKNTGAQITVTGDASLKAGRDITFDTVVDNEKSTQYGVQGHDKVVDTSATNVKSGLTVGGSLGAQAGRDITLAGTDATIAGDASLNAGRDISIVARNDTSSHTTSDTSHGFLGTSTTTTDHTDTKSTNVASNFNVGGSLGAQSGRDVNVVGSNVAVTGDALVVAGRDFNVKNGTNAQTSSDSTVTTGLGVNNALFGSIDDKTTTKDTQNVSSNFKVGGQGIVLASRDANVTGSNVSAGSGGIQAARDVNVTAGQDTHSVDHTVTSNSILKVSGSSDGSASLGANASGDASAQANVGGLQAGAAAGGNAGAGYDLSSGGSASASRTAAAGTGGSNPAAPENGDLVGAQANVGGSAGVSGQATSQTNAGLALYNNTITTSHEDSTTAKSSNVSFGKNGALIAGNNINLTGASVSAGGQLALSAANINIKAAENTHNTSSSAMSSSAGLLANNQTNLSANAGVSASGNASVGASNGSGSAAAGASASIDTSAQGSSNTDVDYLQNSQSTRSSSDVTHTGSSISGGSVVMNAKNNLNVVGSDLSSKGDMVLGAKNMTFAAAQDTHTTSASDRLTGYGLYADTSGNASAGAQAGASAGVGASAGGAPSKDLGAQAGANAGAQGDAGYGAQIHNNMQSSTSDTSTARTSTLNVGGSLTRVASNNITDVGTQIAVSGDLNQASETYTNKAAANTTSTSSNSNAETIRYGLYGDAGATASANAGVSPGVGANGKASAGQSTGAGAGAGAEAGVGASLNASGGYSKNDTSQAVVSNINTNGSVNIQTSGKTSLEGTNIAGANGINLAVGSLDFKAAKNTTSGVATQQSVLGQANVGVDAETTVGGGGSVNYSGSQLVNQSSQAVAGSLTSNGPINVQTKGDANFEGTQIATNSDVNLNVGKNLNYSAARDTTFAVGGSQTAQVGATLSGKTQSVNGEVGVQVGESQSSTAHAGGIYSNGNINVKTGGSATLEGTQLASAGSTAIDAKGNVNLLAAQSTSQDFTGGVNLGGSFATNSQKVNTTPTAANSSSPSLQGGGAGALAAASTGAPNAATSAAGTVGAGGSNSTFSVNGGVNAQYNQSTTAQAVGISSNGGVSIRSGAGDANLQGAQIVANGPVKISAARDVNLSTADSSSTSAGGAIGANFGGSYATPAATAKTPAAATPATPATPPGGWTSATPSAGTTRMGSTAIGAQRGSSDTAAPTLPAGGAGALTTKGSTASPTSLPSGGAGAQVAKATTVAAPPSGGSVDAVGGQASVNGAYTSVKQGVSISGGSVDVSAGRDVSASGGSIDSKSNTNLNAGRNITLASADNVNFGAGLSASLGKGDDNSNSIGGASLSGGFAQQGMTIKSSGGTTLNSGGSTSLQGTQVASGGGTAVNAVGGVSKSSTVSGSASLSASEATAGGSISGVSLSGKGGSKETTGAAAAKAIAQQGPAVQAPPVVIPAMIGKPIVIAQPGQVVTVTTPDGKPAPAWVVYNPTTGAVTANPPAGYTGTLSFTTTAPTADGATTTQTLSFGQTAPVAPSTTFGASYSPTKNAAVSYSGKPTAGATP